MKTTILQIANRGWTRIHANKSSLKRRCVPIALCLLAAPFGLCLTGCLSRPALVHQDFALQTPAAAAPASAGQGVLAVQPVEVSPLFASRALVYRTGPNTYETDPYAGFLVAPGDALGIPIRAYLANSGVFANVVASGSPLKASQLLQVQATELYGDFRQPGQPAADLSLRLVLVNAGGNVLWHKDYARSVPLKKNTAAGVVAGYDQALAEIMAEVAADLKAFSNQ
jgi:cholesterol transport system auxiliary component